MEFSEVHRHGGICLWSPDGRLLATVSAQQLRKQHSASSRSSLVCAVLLWQTDNNKIIVRQAETLQPHCSFTAAEAVSTLEWSPDSCLLLCCHLSSSCLQVFSLSSPAFVCRIDESPLGLLSARFAPDSRHVLTTAAFCLRLSIYPLFTPPSLPASSSPPSYCIRRPKHCAAASSAPLAFSPFPHHLLAVAERHAFKDYVGVYSLSPSPCLLHHFGVSSSSLSSLSFSPSSLLIAICDSALDCSLAVYTVDGRQQLHWTGENEEAMGVRTVQWGGEDWLAVGGYDDTVRLFHTGSWRLVSQWSVGADGQRLRRGTAVYVEKVAEGGGGDGDKENERQFSMLEAAIGSDIGLGGKEEATAAASRPSHHHALSSLAAALPASTARHAAAAPRHRASQSIAVTAQARPPSASSAASDAAGRPTPASNRPTRAAATARPVRPLSMSYSSSMRKASISSLAAFAPAPPTVYSLAPLPYTLPAAPPPLPLTVPIASSDGSAPAVGVSLLSFSPSRSFLLVASSSSPCVLQIVHVPSLSLHSVIVNLQPVEQAEWLSTGAETASASGDCLLYGGGGSGGRVYMWRESGCSVLEVPVEGFVVRSLAVSGAAAGGAAAGRVCLMDRSRFTCLYVNTQSTTN